MCARQNRKRPRQIGHEQARPFAHPLVRHLDHRGADVEGGHFGGSLIQQVAGQEPGTAAGIDHAQTFDRAELRAHRRMLVIPILGFGFGNVGVSPGQRFIGLEGYGCVRV